MIRDGEDKLNISYNALNLPSKIEKQDDTFVDFLYLSDGTKLSVSNDDGTGLEYRGPFVFRKSAEGEVAFESAACPEGRLTESASLLYVPDFLGSIRMVIDAGNGTVLEASDYSAFGTRTQKITSALPDEVSLRDHFTGCEDLKTDFNLPYTDHSARFYFPSLQRWMVPDPLSEQYYGISPYAYCNNNPLSYKDLDGNRILDKNGKEITYDSDKGWSPNITKEQCWYFDMLMSTDIGSQLLFDVMKSTANVYVNFSDDIVKNKKGYIKSGQNALSINEKNGLIVKSEITLFRNGMEINYLLFQENRFKLPFEYYKVMVMAHELQHLFNGTAFPEILDSDERVRQQEKDSKRKMLDIISELSSK